MTTSDLNLMAPVNTLGYGVVGFNILKSLVEAGVKVAWWPIGGVEIEDQANGPLLQTCINNQQFFKNDAPSLRIFHQFSMAESIGNGRRIGWPIFELDTFNDMEKHHLMSLSQIVFCSQWAKEAFLSQNIHYIYPPLVVPLGVDRTIFHENYNLRQSDDFVFVSIGKWEVRKGHDVILEAFNRTFRKDDKVKLVMACFNPNTAIIGDRNEQWCNYYMSSPLSSKITVVNKRLPNQHEVARLMGASDCGLFPARAEGWNLELLEMMACGKPVITTNYSAHTEFCNKDNAMLIDIEDTELAYDKPYFYGQGKWAHLGKKQMEQLCEHMRQAYENGIGKKNVAGIETSKKFSWAESAKKIMRIIND